MGFVERDLDRIRIALGAVATIEMRDQLLAAQQALVWALDPTNFMSPADMLLGIAAGPGDCFRAAHPARSSRIDEVVPLEQPPRLPEEEHFDRAQKA